MTAALADKTFIVTGASGSVGSATAQQMAAAGAKLALVDIAEDRLNDVIAQLGGDANRFKAYPTDLNDPDSVQAMVARVAGDFGGLNGLVHTVGGYAAGDPAHKAGVDVLDKMFMLNARTLYLTCAAVAAHLVEAGTPGSIAVVLARAARQGGANHSAYTASKAAAVRIMESMALELRDHGIRVNGVSPSIVDTPPNRDAMSSADFDKWVKPAQIGDLMVFLSSDAAAAITGANVEINARS